MSWYFNNGVRTPAGDAAHLNPPGSGERLSQRTRRPTMAKSFDLERFALVGGAQVPGAIHLWGYTAEPGESWLAPDYFAGSGMRAGDWLLLTVRHPGECRGVLYVVATDAPCVMISRAS